MGFFDKIVSSSNVIKKVHERDRERRRDREREVEAAITLARTANSLKTMPRTWLKSLS